jgi:hypothetical protein
MITASAAAASSRFETKTLPKDMRRLTAVIGYATSVSETSGVDSIGPWQVDDVFAMTSQRNANRHGADTEV